MGRGVINQLWGGHQPSMGGHQPSMGSVALSGQQTLVELHASRTNEICTMYIEEFILVDVVTLLYMDELNCIGKCCSLYTVATMDEKG